MSEDGSDEEGGMAADGRQPSCGLGEALERVDSIAAGGEAVELESPDAFGRYTGLPPQVVLLDDGRRVRLVTPLSYIRDDASEWPVPPETVVDGASIPRPFWTLIGGPFEGKYRNGSIVHDHYCVVKTRPWQDTHRMFHDAIRCSGVSSTRAKIMFYAVYRFGPRWPGMEEGVADTVEPSRTPTDADGASLVEAAKAIAADNPSLDEIERMADAQDRNPRG